MKKIFTILLCAIMFAFTVNAAGVWSIKGHDYSVDTLQHIKIGPGTTLTKLKLEGSKKLRLFYVTADLTNKNLEVRNVKANDEFGSLSTVSSMAKKATETKGATFFAGTNADFFDFGSKRPCGFVAADGELYFAKGAQEWASFGISDDKTPIIGQVIEVKGTAKIGGTDYAINGFNAGRGTDDLILYSQKMGANTATNSYGTEIALMPVDGSTAILGRTAKMKAVSAPQGAKGSMAIPAGGFVLSGHGTNETLVASLAEGQEIEITAYPVYDGVAYKNITQISGGQPVILKNSEILETEHYIDHLSSNQPRTAVGYNKKNQLVQIVVDGRSAISAGCTTKELAEIMRHIGCTEAMNFDGGGSSTIYAGPILGVQNVVSGGTERAVTNGLYLTAKCQPDDKVVTSMEATDSYAGSVVRLPQYGIYTPEFMGYNQAELLVNTHIEGVVLSLDNEAQKFGEIINDGKTLYITASAGQFTLIATYGNAKKYIPVVIEAGEMSFKHKNVLLDNIRDYSVEVESTILEKKMPLDNRALTWTSTDTEIATVDNGTGIVHGLRNGTTQIIGKTDNFCDTLNVTIQAPTAAAMSVFYPTFPTDLKVKMNGGKDVTVAEYQNGFKLDYTGTGSGRGAYFSIDHQTTLWSLPEAIRIKINPGDADIKKITIKAENALGESNTAWVFTDKPLPKNQESAFTLNLSDWCDINNVAIYPIRLNSMNFSMGASSKGKAFTVLVSGLEGLYPHFSGVEQNTITHAAVSLYPNPVEAGSDVNVINQGNATVSVYALNGTQVLQQAIEGNAAISTDGMATGIYLVKVTTADATHTSKLIVR